jgi:hypothetical protein
LQISEEAKTRRHNSAVLRLAVPVGPAAERLAVPVGPAAEHLEQVFLLGDEN